MVATNSTNQTNKAVVRAINQSIYLRCLCLAQIPWYVVQPKMAKASLGGRITMQNCECFSLETANVNET